MNKFMNQAIKEAEKGFSLGHGGPFGAVIVKNGKIIGRVITMLSLIRTQHVTKK